MIPTTKNLLEMHETRHRTLFSIIEQEELVGRMAELAQEISGDLHHEHTGFSFVLPILKAVGLQHQPKNL